MHCRLEDQSEESSLQRRPLRIHPSQESWCFRMEETRCSRMGGWALGTGSDGVCLRRGRHRAKVRENPGVSPAWNGSRRSSGWARWDVLGRTSGTRKGKQRARGSFVKWVMVNSGCAFQLVKGGAPPHSNSPCPKRETLNLQAMILPVLQAMYTTGCAVDLVPRQAFSAGNGRDKSSSNASVRLYSGRYRQQALEARARHT